VVLGPNVSVAALEQLRDDRHAAAGAGAVQQVLDAVQLDRGRTLVADDEVGQLVLGSIS
jgi:hypothetical protein